MVPLVAFSSGLPGSTETQIECLKPTPLPQVTGAVCGRLSRVPGSAPGFVPFPQGRVAAEEFGALQMTTETQSFSQVSSDKCDI